MDARVPPTPPAPEAALLKASEAAAYLNVSRATFYRHVVPHLAPVRIGAAPRWRRTDLDAWLAQAAAAGAGHERR